MKTEQIRTESIQELRQIVGHQQAEIDQLRGQLDQCKQQQVRAEIAINHSRPADPLLDRVRAYVHTHLDDSNLSVEQIAKAMSMSRMSLHRKLKAQAGLSATQFIRDIRLRHAATLLMTQMPISTVAYTVGIESPGYFARIFRQMFGMTPTEYILQNEKSPADSTH